MDPGVGDHPLQRRMLTLLEGDDDVVAQGLGLTLDEHRVCGQSGAADAKSTQRDRVQHPEVDP